MSTTKSSQKTKTKKQSKAAKKKQPKIAICIHSYTRPVDCLRQIYAMVDQSYKETHLFVAVKGVSEHVYTTFILPQIHHLVEEGKLTIKLCANSNQLTNFLDTVRGEDISEYDAFMKCDDDDFYHRDYLSVIAEALQLLPAGSSTYIAGSLDHIHPDVHSTTYKVNNYGYYAGWGTSLVMSKAVMDHLFEVEANPKLMADNKANWYPEGGNTYVQCDEDRYMYNYMLSLGASDVYGFFTQKGINSPIIVGNIIPTNSPSRTKGFMSSDMIRGMRDLANKDAPKEQYLETERYEIYRVFGDMAVETGTKTMYKIREMEADHIVLVNANDHTLVRLDKDPITAVYRYVTA